MTNKERIKEAIETLNDILNEATETEDSVCYVTSCDEEPLRIAIEAPEKQTPKKPNYVYEDEPLCPYCGAVLDYCESPCENCNQFIDWSEEK